jgi:secreted trypsin-like serine protease
MIPVDVLSSDVCEADFLQRFCSQFNSTDSESCSAPLGSPVVCEDGDIAGILINDGKCSEVGDNALLFYHSIESFIDWIEDVVAETKRAPRETTTRPPREIREPTEFIVNVVHFEDIGKTKIRCSGTVVSRRHVVTAASCVDVSEPVKIGVRMMTIEGTITGELEEVD